MGMNATVPSATPPRRPSHRRIRLAAAAFLAALALVPVAASHAAPGVQARSDVRYAGRDGLPLRLDEWRPRGASVRSRRPIVVMVHGGGWRAGSRSEWARHGWPQTFAATGYVVVAPSYRLACERPGPEADATTRAAANPLCGHSMAEQRRDVVDAIRWSVRNARRLGGDPNRIVLVGGSAGAHLALLAASHPAVRDRIAGVVAISPPVDIDYIGSHSLWLHGAVERAIRCTWRECRWRWKSHSPLHVLQRRRGMLPPTYLYASRRDLRVRHVDVLRLGAVLRRRSVGSVVREPIVATSACHGPWACERFAVAHVRMPLRRDVLRWVAGVTRPPAVGIPQPVRRR